MSSEQLKLSEWAVEILSCPTCGGELKYQDEIRCLNKKCNVVFPIVKGVPVLIDSKNSLYSIDDFINMKDTYFRQSKSRFNDRLLKLAPKIGVNIKAKRNYDKLVKLLLVDFQDPKVLVLGGSILGKGMDKLVNSSIELVETDVSFGIRTMAIVDAHNIPFEASSFDAVIVQAVLEHTANPYACVKEIYRILKKDGLVYAETAFMQQVHGGNFDFTRFTYLGHRRLFAQFHEIESGAMCGTGMALSWAYEYFLRSLTKSATIGSVARLFARLTAFWMKYFDYLTINNPATLEGASGYYFIGRRSDPVPENKVLDRSYR